MKNLSIPSAYSILKRGFFALFALSLLFLPMLACSPTPVPPEAATATASATCTDDLIFVDDGLGYINEPVLRLGQVFYVDRLRMKAFTIQDVDITTAIREPIGDRGNINNNTLTISVTASYGVAAADVEAALKLKVTESGSFSGTELIGWRLGDPIVDLLNADEDLKNSIINTVPITITEFYVVRKIRAAKSLDLWNNFAVDADGKLKILVKGIAVSVDFTQTCKTHYGNSDLALFVATQLTFDRDTKVFKTTGNQPNFDGVSFYDTRTLSIETPRDLDDYAQDAVRQSAELSPSGTYALLIWFLD